MAVKKQQEEDEGILWMRVSASGMRVLVVGGGQVAARKVKKMLAAKAIVEVVAPSLGSELSSLSEQVCWTCARIEETELLAPGGVRGYLCVIAATDDAAINERIAKRCAEQGVLVQVVDRSSMARSTVMLPRVSRMEHGVEVALFLGGASPYLTGMLAARLERLIRQEESWWLEGAAMLRKLRRAHLDRFARGEEVEEVRAEPGRKRAYFARLTRRVVAMLQEGATAQEVWDAAEAGFQEEADALGSRGCARGVKEVPAQRRDDVDDV